MIPLSMQNLGQSTHKKKGARDSGYLSSVAKTWPPLSRAIIPIISCNLSLPLPAIVNLDCWKYKKPLTSDAPDDEDFFAADMCHGSLSDLHEH